MGFPQLTMKQSRKRVEAFAGRLNGTMITMKLNRAMAQLRHLNPDMFRVINDLWKNEIGVHNLFKLKFTLTYVITYLEEYLTQCETRF